MKYFALEVEKVQLGLLLTPPALEVQGIAPFESKHPVPPDVQPDAAPLTPKKEQYAAPALMVQVMALVPEEDHTS